MFIHICHPSLFMFDVLFNGPDCPSAYLSLSKYFVNDHVCFHPAPLNYTSVIDWWCLGVVLESIAEKLGEK